MEINTSEFGDVSVVALNGQIDGNTAPSIQTSVMDIAQAHPHLLLNMSAVTYMSSAGLRLLLQLHRAVASNSGRMVLAGLSEEIQDTMSATGFLSLFETYPTVDEALAVLNHGDTLNAGTTD